MASLDKDQWKALLDGPKEWQWMETKEWPFEIGQMSDFWDRSKEWPFELGQRSYLLR